MDVGHVLSNVPPVVENIFRYLNKRELDCCSQVCDLWKRVAETERNSRDDIASFFQVLYCSLHDKMHSSFTRECSLDIAGDMENDLSKQLKELKTSPTFCLAFASNYFVSDFDRLFPSFQYPPSLKVKRVKQADVVRKRAYLKAVIQTSLGQFLPENCKTTFCVAPGIIGCHKNLLPLEIEEGFGISGIIIPHVPGLQIFNFPIDEKQCDISKLIPKDVDIKCLLVFITPHESSCFNKIVQSCLLKQKSQLAIGGALIERSESGSGCCVAFCGRSVEAASIIINPNDRETELENKLKSFNETGLLKDSCFAFMFTCVARGYFIYREYNTESSIFHKLYPEVPLVGVFGNGEIGVNYLPNSPSANENKVLRIGKLTRCRKRYLHSYTTIFVLVSIK